MSCSVGKISDRSKRTHYKHRVSEEYSASLKERAALCNEQVGIETHDQGHALEWGEHGVRVNGLAPGFILTDLLLTLVTGTNAGVGIN